jgi:hypothetical protein
MALLVLLAVDTNGTGKKGGGMGSTGYAATEFPLSNWRGDMKAHSTQHSREKCKVCVKMLLRSQQMHKSAPVQGKNLVRFAAQRRVCAACEE